MATVEITRDNIKQTLSNNDIVVVCFHTQWSEPAQQYAKTFAEAAEQNAGVVFGLCDAESQGRLVEELGISEVPTLVVFREEIGVFAWTGGIAADRFGRLIQSTRELPMDHIREEMEGKHVCRCGRQAAMAKIAADQRSGDPL